MHKMNVNTLLRPKSIAVVGASDKGGFGKSTCVNLLKSPIVDHIYFINPKRDEVLGKKCYKSLSEISERVELVILNINKKLVPAILKEASGLGCRAAVVYASGYGETGSAEDKQAEIDLASLCSELDMAVMGVNCAGFVNNIDGIFAFGMILEGGARRGNIGIISQSGKICLNMMQMEHMKYSYLISCGNSTVLKIEDYIDYLIDDDNTKVIGLYLEGIKSPKRLTEVLRKAALKKKPIVVLKVGRSAKGSAVAASHTGSLSGSDKGYDAVFKKFGVIRVNDIEELLQTCYVFSTLPKLPENGTFSAMSLSGGETGVCADVGTLNDIDFPEFSEETNKALKSVLPDFATINNPLDMTATLAHDGEKYAEAVKIVMNDPNVGMVLTGFSILPKHKVTDVIYPMSDGMVMAAKSGIKPLAVMSFIDCSRDDFLRDKLENAGVPILPATGYGFRILKYLKDYVEYDPKKVVLDLAVPDKTNKKQRIALSEHDSKLDLAEVGIKIPKEVVVSSKEELINAADKIGYPIVAKIESAEILHKTDVGGVRLGIKDDEQLLKAYDSIMQSVSVKAPEAKVNGVLLQEMLPSGVEVIIGVNNDPQFGPMVLCGLGGVFVEIFKDVSLYPAPLNHYEAEKMVKSLKGYKLLAGYRGQAKCDIKALVDLIVNVSNYAVQNKDDISELDLNPVFVHTEGKGVSIADALIIKKSF